MLTKIDGISKWWQEILETEGASAPALELSFSGVSVVPTETVRKCYGSWLDASSLSVMPIEDREFSKILWKVVPGLGRLRPRINKKQVYCVVFPSLEHDDLVDILN